MLPTCFFDTEGLGLHSPSVLLQYAFDDADPTLYDLWLEPAGKTRDLFRRIVESRVVAHNLTFDWGRLQAFWSGLHAFGDNERPIDDVSKFIVSEYENRSVACLKPPKAVCTLLLCQKQLGGSALATKEIRVRRIPERVAEDVARILTNNTNLPAILFAKRADRDQRWRVADSDGGPGWNDIVLSFAPSNALKDIAELVFGDAVTRFDEIAPPGFAAELGYAPFYYLNNGDGTGLLDGKPMWPLLLHDHINHWKTEPSARKYAAADVTLLRKLYRHLGAIDTDFDGEMACQVASVRISGMSFDNAMLQDQIDYSSSIVDTAAVNVDSHVQVRQYIAEALDPMEALVVADGCRKEILEKVIQTFSLPEEEECCDDGCPRCDGKKVVGPGPMPVADRAAHILEIRKHRKRLQLYTKLSECGGHIFPSFRVVGTKSGRMSSGDGINYHAIDSSKEIREMFTLAEDVLNVVSGGDFDSQELAIAAAVMNDAGLADDIAKGKSLHGVFAAEASGIPYERIMKFKDDKSTTEAHFYKISKICVYAILYGASAFNIAQTLKVSEADADRIIQGFFEKYPYMAETRKWVKKSLEALSTDENGRLVIHKPERTSVESVFGYSRSFQVEFAVMHAMVKSMDEIKETIGKSIRETLNKTRGDNDELFTIRSEKKGRQTLDGAIISALYGSTFSLQGKILRAALNHLIQSAGRTITLRVQKRSWDVQPVGITPFRVKLMSIHDEIMVTSSMEDAITIRQAVVDEVADICKTVPLTSLGWAVDGKSWFGTKASKDVTRCGWGSETTPTDASYDIQEEIDELLETEVEVQD